MTEKMTAHLYLSSESFKYNGTDSDDAIKNKLALFYDLVKTLVANKNENKLFVFQETVEQQQKQNVQISILKIANTQKV